MRLFVALDIDDAIRERIALFQDGVGGFASDAKWVRAESLHITLKFIGEVSSEMLEQIRAALSPVSVSPFALTLRGIRIFSNRERSTSLLDRNRSRPRPRYTGR